LGSEQAAARARHLRHLERLGARFVAEVEHDGAGFLKYRLDTA
jgi:hypothetical protein